MPEHQTPLIATIAAGLMLAFVLGLIAHRLRVQPLVGYLPAGVVVGPCAPGVEADPALAARAANPALDILARAHSNAAVDHLSKLGANLVVLGESETADRMLERAQRKSGAS